MCQPITSTAHSDRTEVKRPFWRPFSRNTLASADTVLNFTTTGFYFCSGDPRTMTSVKVGSIKHSDSDCDSLWTPDFHGNKSDHELIFSIAKELSYRMMINESSPWQDLYNNRNRIHYMCKCRIHCSSILM